MLGAGSRGWIPRAFVRRRAAGPVQALLRGRPAEGVSMRETVSCKVIDLVLEEGRYSNQFSCLVAEVS